MEIIALKIFSNKINAQEDFYKTVLGFHCFSSNDTTLEIKAGDSKLILEKSTKKFYYHFAFLIPTGSLEAAIHYLESRFVQLLPLNGDKIIHFDTGRAIYFYDADGNIVEFIERPSLNYPTRDGFSIDSIIKLNEIGLPVSDPVKMTKRLTSEFGIHPIKNAPLSKRFCWVGDFNGAIITILEGRHWLPTKKSGIVNDFAIKYKDQGTVYKLSFVNNEIKVKCF